MKDKNLLIRCGFREDYNPDNRQLAVDYVEVNNIKYLISTIDLGYNMSFCSSVELYYETMVFDNNGNSLYCDRYETKEIALEGHKYVLDNFSEVIK